MHLQLQKKELLCHVVVAPQKSGVKYNIYIYIYLYISVQGAAPEIEPMSEAAIQLSRCGEEMFPQVVGIGETKNLSIFEKISLKW